MTPQEQQMIDGLVSRVRSTQVQNKDTDAERHIHDGLAGTPDALYILVQTVLVQQYGLDQAQAQIDSLKQQVEGLQQAHAPEPSQGGGSFLSHIFGGGATGSSAPARNEGSYQPVNYPPQQTSAYPAPPPPPYGQTGYPASGGGMFGGGGGGFLRGAMQTAAGVAAGEMMFRGMEDLFSGFGEHGRGFTGSGGETIVNNYGDEGSSSHLGGDSTRDDGGFYNPSDDASRQNFGDTAGFSDSNSDMNDTTSADSSDDFGGVDDSDSFDNSSSDDFSNDDNS